MKFREIFRFEFVYQARRVRTWLYFAVLFVVAYLLRDGVVNSPFAIAQETILTGLLWILMAPAVAGSAAARRLSRHCERVSGEIAARFGLHHDLGHVALQSMVRDVHLHSVNRDVL